MQLINIVGSNNLSPEAKEKVYDFLQNRFSIEDYLQDIETKPLNQ